MNTSFRRYAAVITAGFGVYGSAAADDATTVHDLIVEPPTLVSLGFEWPIDGDSNRNAVVQVSFRERGSERWQEGLPLLRLHGERITRPPLEYTVPNMFAGSIFDLKPDFIIFNEAYGELGLMRDPRFDEQYRLLKEFPFESGHSHRLLVFVRREERQ